MKCPNCRAEIAYDADPCPQCGKKKPNELLEKLWKVIAIVIIAVILKACLGN